MTYFISLIALFTLFFSFFPNFIFGAGRHSLRFSFETFKIVCHLKVINDGLIHPKLKWKSFRLSVSCSRKLVASLTFYKRFFSFCGSFINYVEWKEQQLIGDDGRWQKPLGIWLKNRWIAIDKSNIPRRNLWTFTSFNCKFFDCIICHTTLVT